MDFFHLEETPTISLRFHPLKSKGKEGKIERGKEGNREVKHGHLPVNCPGHCLHCLAPIGCQEFRCQVTRGGSQ